MSISSAPERRRRHHASSASTLASGRILVVLEAQPRPFSSLGLVHRVALRQGVASGELDEAADRAHWSPGRSGGPMTTTTLVAGFGGSREQGSRKRTNSRKASQGGKNDEEVRMSGEIGQTGPWKAEVLRKPCRSFQSLPPTSPPRLSPTNSRVRRQGIPLRLSHLPVMDPSVSAAPPTSSFPAHAHQLAIDEHLDRKSVV